MRRVASDVRCPSRPTPARGAVFPRRRDQRAAALNAPPQPTCRAPPPSACLRPRAQPTRSCNISRAGASRLPPALLGPRTAPHTARFTHGSLHGSVHGSACVSSPRAPPAAPQPISRVSPMASRISANIASSASSSVVPSNVASRAEKSARRGTMGAMGPSERRTGRSCNHGIESK